MQTPPYEVIAAEYYDTVRHPTCAAFRSASLSLIERNLDLGRLSNADVLEVGCGRSIFCDIERAAWGNLLVLDECVGMLEYSRQCLPDGVRCVVGNALATDLPDDSVDILISSLGDPYNVSEFWIEASRVLRSRGLVVFTTPSFDWSTRYRPSAKDPAHSALFLVSSGDFVETPSFIFSEEEQRRIIADAHLKVVSTDELLLSQLDANLAKQAPKLLDLDPAEPVVSLFICGQL